LAHPNATVALDNLWASDSADGAITGANDGAIALT
jgi:hypothetical protein